MLFLLYLLFFVASTKSKKIAVCKYVQALDYDQTRSTNLINATTYKYQISKNLSDQANGEKQVKSNLGTINKTEMVMLKNQLQS